MASGLLIGLALGFAAGVGFMLFLVNRWLDDPLRDDA